MATQVYKTLSKIFGIILLVVGIAALSGGLYADSFIKAQLEEQDVVLPTTESIDGQLKAGRIAQEDADALYPVAGEAVVTGDQARIFANHYIHAHMRAAVVDAGLDPDTTTFATVGKIASDREAVLTEEIAADNPAADDATITKMVKAEIANPLTEYDIAAEVANLNSLRYDTLLDGNTLRGMLLNAYGWGLLGTIAKLAGAGLAVVGLLLTVFGFVYKGRKVAVE
ncbi:MAG: hypothetical protein SPG34_03005 [Trueperella sp.]|uniref:hypothetical protein n=1 Tax=Trueperella sp. TaxID=2699835 RepID=UPI002A910996|nr:hypothetical protein [Trueperella sp.]MDY5403293.1 hypothetical protein [Trueperella sp.]